MSLINTNKVHLIFNYIYFSRCESEISIPISISLKIPIRPHVYSMGIFKLLLWVFHRRRCAYDTHIYPLVSHDVYSDPSAAYIRFIPVQQNRPPRNRDPIYRIDVNFINPSRMVDVDYTKLDLGHTSFSVIASERARDERSLA